MTYAGVTSGVSGSDDDDDDDGGGDGVSIADAIDTGSSGGGGGGGIDTSTGGTDIGSIGDAIRKAGSTSSDDSSSSGGSSSDGSDDSDGSRSGVGSLGSIGEAMRDAGSVSDEEIDRTSSDDRASSISSGTTGSRSGNDPVSEVTGAIKAAATTSSEGDSQSTEERIDDSVDDDSIEGETLDALRDAGSSTVEEVEENTSAEDSFSDERFDALQKSAEVDVEQVQEGVAMKEAAATDITEGPEPDDSQYVGDPDNSDVQTMREIEMEQGSESERMSAGFSPDVGGLIEKAPDVTVSDDWTSTEDALGFDATDSEEVTEAASDASPVYVSDDWTSTEDALGYDSNTLNSFVEMGDELRAGDGRDALSAAGDTTVSASSAAGKGVLDIATGGEAEEWRAEYREQNPGWRDARQHFQQGVEKDSAFGNEGPVGKTLGGAYGNLQATNAVLKTAVDVGADNPNQTYNLQDKSQRALSTVSGADNKEELAAQIEQTNTVFERGRDRLDDRLGTEGTATDAVADWTFDALVKDPAMGVTTAATGIDPETGETNARAEPINLIDPVLWGASGGSYGAAKGAQAGARAGSALSKSDEAAGIGARLASRFSRSGGDDAASTADDVAQSADDGGRLSKAFDRLRSGSDESPTPNRVQAAGFGSLGSSMTSGFAKLGRGGLKLGRRVVGRSSSADEAAQVGDDVADTTTTIQQTVDTRSVGTQTTNTDRAGSSIDDVSDSPLGNLVDDSNTVDPTPDFGSQASIDEVAETSDITTESTQIVEESIDFGRNTQVVDEATSVGDEVTQVVEESTSGVDEVPQMVKETRIIDDTVSAADDTGGAGNIIDDAVPGDAQPVNRIRNTIDGIVSGSDDAGGTATRLSDDASGAADDTQILDDTNVFRADEQGGAVDNAVDDFADATDDFVDDATGPNSPTSIFDDAARGSDDAADSSTSIFDDAARGSDDATDARKAGDDTNVRGSGASAADDTGQAGAEAGETIAETADDAGEWFTLSGWQRVGLGGMLSIFGTTALMDIFGVNPLSGGPDAPGPMQNGNRTTGDHMGDEYGREEVKSYDYKGEEAATLFRILQVGENGESTSEIGFAIVTGFSDNANGDMTGQPNATIVVSNRGKPAAWNGLTENVPSTRFGSEGSADDAWQSFKDFMDNLGEQEEEPREDPDEHPTLEGSLTLPGEIPSGSGFEGDWSLSLSGGEVSKSQSGRLQIGVSVPEGTFVIGEAGNYTIEPGAATASGQFAIRRGWKALQPDDYTFQLVTEVDGGLAKLASTDVTVTEPDTSGPGEGEPGSEWGDAQVVEELPKGWLLYAQPRVENEDEVRFFIAGKREDGTLIYIQPGGKVKEGKPHFFPTVEKAGAAFEEWLKRHESGRTSGDETPSESAGRPQQGRVNRQTKQKDDSPSGLWDRLVGFARRNPYKSVGAFAVSAAAVGWLWKEGYLDWILNNPVVKTARTFSPLP